MKINIEINEDDFNKLYYLKNRKWGKTGVCVTFADYIHDLVEMDIKAKYGDKCWNCEGEGQLELDCGLYIDTVPCHICTPQKK